MTVLVVWLALLVDRLLGEPRRWHPLVGFGALVSSVEKRLRSQSAATPARQIAAGGVGWAVLVIIPTSILLICLSILPLWSQWLVDIAVLYLAVGYRSLGEHAQAVAVPLMAGDLPAARAQVAMIVSRDTASLDEPSVAKATVESVLENGSDAIFAPIFWYLIAGSGGVLLYRLANTLDARWGYRNDKYLYFGRVAARLDDLLNWLPARCCALAYALAGNWSTAMRSWRSQAPQTASPNAGVVMAAGAGGLRVSLGGTAVYHGEQEWRPQLGCGPQAQPKDIGRAVTLLRNALLISVLACSLGYVLVFFDSVAGLGA